MSDPASQGGCSGLMVTCWSKALMGLVARENGRGSGCLAQNPPVLLWVRPGL